jgi:hypothetical protein
MTSTTAGIIRKGFQLFSRLLQIDSNTFVLVPYPDLLQLPLHVEDMDARKTTTQTQWEYWNGKGIHTWDTTHNISMN